MCCMRPFCVVGDPIRVAGDPQLVVEDPIHIAGDPQRVVGVH